MLFIEWQALPGFEFVFAGRFHAFIEAGDQDLAVGVFQLADDFNRRTDLAQRRRTCRNGDRSWRPRLQFRYRPCRAGPRNRGQFGREHLGIADQREVGFQFGFLCADIGFDDSPPVSSSPSR